jgi:outer membrane protein assembly factor BamB
MANVLDAGGKEPGWGFGSSPLVIGDKVVVQAGGAALAVAYDKMTGSIAWKSPSRNAGYAAVTMMKANEKPILLIFHASGLSFIDPSEGREISSLPWKTSPDVNATTPAVEGTTVFITSGYKTGCEAIDASDSAKPREMWSNKSIASHHSDPIIIDGFVYGYSGQSTQNKGSFKCVELKTGAERWSTNEIGWGTAFSIDGHILCMDIEGNLYLVKPVPDSFKKIAEFKTALGEAVKDPAWTIPVAANGKLYVRYMQRLICYNLMP